MPPHSRAPSRKKRENCVAAPVRGRRFMGLFFTDLAVDEGLLHTALLDDIFILSYYVS